MKKVYCVYVSSNAFKKQRSKVSSSVAVNSHLSIQNIHGFIRDKIRIESVKKNQKWQGLN